MTGSAFVPQRAEPVLRPSDALCANCGALAPGAYCPECGQNTRERVPTFVQFMREATGRYLTFEGKLWKTLFPLLCRPGFLTRAYFAGQRRRYIGPARLFLVSSLLLFAVLGFVSETLEIDHIILSDKPETSTRTKATAAEPDAKDASAASPATKPARESEGLTLDDDLNVDLSFLPEPLGVLKKRIQRFNHLNRTQKAEQILAGVLRYGPYAMFALLPAFAALLKVLYLGRRRKYPSRPGLYGEHLVFAAHNHAFLFLALSLLVVLPSRLVQQALACWILVYFALSMRRVYGGTWRGIVARGAVLVIVYAVLFSLVTAGLVIAAILLR